MVCPPRGSVLSRTRDAWAATPRRSPRPPEPLPPSPHASRTGHSRRASEPWLDLAFTHCGVILVAARRRRPQSLARYVSIRRPVRSVATPQIILSLTTREVYSLHIVNHTASASDAPFDTTSAMQLSCIASHDRLTRASALTASPGNARALVQAIPARILKRSNAWPRMALAVDAHGASDVLPSIRRLEAFERACLGTQRQAVFLASD